MRILPLCLVIGLVLCTSIPANAQNASPTSPTRVDVLAVGGFLGQRDGWCEQPGGTYDLSLVNRAGVQSCAGFDGQVKTGSWPVAMGGVLGARSWVTSERYADALEGRQSIFVVAGNNQIANFTFYGGEVVGTKADYKPTAKTSKPAGLAAERDVQVQERIERFWRELGALQPDAVGLAVEDFIRSLRDPRDDGRSTNKERGSILHRWLRQVTQLDTTIPIIGSNVVIKTHSDDDLNRQKDDGFGLVGVDKNESTSWMAELEVSHPERSGIVLALWEMGAVGQTAVPALANQIASETTQSNSSSTKLRPKTGGLRPGYHYEVRVQDGSDVHVVLKFQTHSALTPRKNSSFPDLDGFPVVTKTLVPAIPARAGSPAEKASPLLILSVVDPSVKSLLGTEAWRWKRRQCKAGEKGCDWSNYTCPEARCEIDFTEPADAIRAVIQRSYAEDTARKPFVVLLSALKDGNTQTLLEEFPEIRMVVLPPDSELLGRSSRVFTLKEESALDKRLARRDNDKQAFSGDLGMFGIVSADRPAATTLIARPEWVGETGARMSADISYSKAYEWLVDKESASVTTIPGAALSWKAEKCPPGTTATRKPIKVGTPAPECTEFSMTWPDDTGTEIKVPYGTFKSYQVCDDKKLDADLTLDDKCKMFAQLASNGDFSTLAGDALRQATGSDLSIVPGGLIDPDAQAWWQTIIDKDHTRALTRFLLERAIYRSFRIVRAVVAGDALVSTIDTALKAKSHEGSCVVGTSTSCSKTIDTKKPDKVLANGRAIDPRSFYTIAMPEGLAEELKLPSSDDDGNTTDAVSAIHERLDRSDGSGWFKTGQAKTLAERISSHGNRRVQYNLLLSEIEVGLSTLQPDAALSDGNTLEALDVEFRGAKPARTVTWKLDGDLAVFDYPVFALRAVTEIDFNRRRDIKKTGDETTYPSNTWLWGGRADLKRRFLGREVRWYAGGFVEREFQGPQEYLTPEHVEIETERFTTTRAESHPILYKRDPLEFNYGAVGVDYLNVKKFPFDSWFSVDLSRVSLQYASGLLYHVPIGVDINGTTYMFGESGADDLVNAYYKDNLEFTKLELKPKYDDPRNQQRIQAEAKLERPFSIHSRDSKIDFEIRYRRFPETSDSTAKSLKTYWRYKLDITLPVLPRVQVVPSVEYHRAHVQDPDPKTGKELFTHLKADINFKFPVVGRTGWRWLLFW